MFSKTYWPQKKRSEAEYWILLKEIMCRQNIWDGRSNAPVLWRTAGTRPAKDKTSSSLKAFRSMMTRLLVIYWPKTCDRKGWCFSHERWWPQKENFIHDMTNRSLSTNIKYRAHSSTYAVFDNYNVPRNVAPKRDHLIFLATKWKTTRASRISVHSKDLLSIYLA